MGRAWEGHCVSIRVVRLLFFILQTVKNNWKEHCVCVSERQRESKRETEMEDILGVMS